MRRFIVITLALFVLWESAPSAWGYYNEVTGLTMQMQGAANQIVTGDTRLLKQDFTVKNTGGTDLSDVGVVWQYMYSGGWTFKYDNQTHTWKEQIVYQGADTGEHWVRLYTSDPSEGVVENTYISMARNNTNVGLVANQYEGYLAETPTLNETDEMPVYWLGDLAAGEEVTFSWFAEQGDYYSTMTNGPWNFHMTNNFVADVQAVPIPPSILQLACGIVGILSLRRKITM